VLAGYGRIIRGAAKKTLDLISAGRGEKIVHTVSGMETYHVTDADSFGKLVLAAQGANIPSPTHHRLAAKRWSALILPDADEKDRKLINDEIDQAITPETVQMQQNQELGLNVSDEAPSDALQTQKAEEQAREDAQLQAKAQPRKKVA
jgi:hypothetical protein